MPSRDALMDFLDHIADEELLLKLHNQLVAVHNRGVRLEFERNLYQL
jgi:hypothetical protein